MNTVGERVSQLLQANNLSQHDLASKIGTTKQTINQICNNKIARSKSLYSIAKFFAVDYYWLTTGSTAKEDGQFQTIADSILYLDEFHKIPALSTRLLNKNLISNNKLILAKVSDEFEVVKDPEYTKLFALNSSNNALSFRFGSSSTLIFHTSLEPRDGDFVIAYLPEKDLFVYRDLKIINDNMVLLPLDEDIYKEITLTNEDIIVAVLYEKRIRRNDGKG